MKAPELPYHAGRLLAFKEVFISEPINVDSSNNSEGLAPDLIYRQVEKIVASPIFAQSHRLTRFLRFVVEQSVQDQTVQLKEYSIGVEVFDRDESYDPRIDPIVRVEASRLRSKLTEYYHTEGRSDPILIEIPKGTYIPLIQKRDPILALAARPAASGAGFRSKVEKTLFAATILLTLSGVTLLWRYLSLQSELRAVRSTGQGIESLTGLDPSLMTFWTPFLRPGRKTYVIFGSPIFFARQQGRLFLRPYTINDPANFADNRDFQELQRQLGPLSGPRYDYASMGDCLALQRLTSFLSGRRVPVNAFPAHQALSNAETIRNGNVIFLGSPRMNPLLEHLPIQQDFQWISDAGGNRQSGIDSPFVRNLKPQPGEQAIYTTSSHEDDVSFAVIGSFPGLQPEHEILLLTAHGGSGTQAVVDYVTQPVSVRFLLDKLQLTEGKRRHYQLLLRIQVFKDAAMKVEYVTHHWIP